MCSGIALAPVVMAEVGIKLSYNIASCTFSYRSFLLSRLPTLEFNFVAGVIHTITSMYSRQFPQIEGM